MIERVHEHIVEELKINARIDTVFVLTAILLDFVILAINSAISGASSTTIIIMFFFAALIVVVNFVVEVGLIKGRQTKAKLISGLIEMYKDNGVDKYYDSSLLQDYKIRYNLFMLVVLFTGILAIAVPFISM